MHSRIFQITSDTDFGSLDTSKTIEDVLNSWDRYPWQVDYCSDISSSKLDAELQGLFTSCFSPSAVFKDLFTYDKIQSTIIFHEGFKKAYFKSNISQLVTVLKDKEFVNKFCDDPQFAYELRSIIEDPLGILILDGSFSLMSLDEFVREIEYETVYHITAVADYHF